MKWTARWQDITTWQMPHKLLFKTRTTDELEDYKGKLREKEGFDIETAKHLLKSVNFLDVTMHMETGEYEPFRKPGPPPTQPALHTKHMWRTHTRQRTAVV